MKLVRMEDIAWPDANSEKIWAGPSSSIPLMFDYWLGFPPQLAPVDVAKKEISGYQGWLWSETTPYRPMVSLYVCPLAMTQNLGTLVKKKLVHGSRHIISGWWLTYPSEKYEFVSWDDYSQIFPICGKINFMFQTTSHSLPSKWLPSGKHT